MFLPIFSFSNFMFVKNSLTIFCSRLHMWKSCIVSESNLLWKFVVGVNLEGKLAQSVYPTFQILVCHCSLFWLLFSHIFPSIAIVILTFKANTYRAYLIYEKSWELWWIRMRNSIKMERESVKLFSCQSISKLKNVQIDSNHWYVVQFGTEKIFYFCNF